MWLAIIVFNTAHIPFVSWLLRLSAERCVDTVIVTKVAHLPSVAAALLEGRVGLLMLRG